MISKGFIKSSFIYTVIGALPLASSVLLLPFYTNLLTTDQFGLLALYIAFTAVMQIVVNFAFDNYVGIHYIENKDNHQKIKEILGTVVASLFIIAGLILLIFLIAGSSVFSLYSSMTENQTILEFYPWGFMSLLTAIFNSMFKTYTNLLIYQQRSVRFLWMNLTNFFLTIGISLAGLYYEPYSLFGPMWGRLLSGVGIFILALYFFLKEYGITFRKIYLKGILAFCSPLLIYFLLVWVMGNIDKYIIAYFLNTSDVAIFGFAINCTFLLEFFQNGLTSSIYPKVYNTWRDQDLKHSTPEVNRYFNGFAAINLISIPLFVIVLPLIIPWVVKNSDFYISFRFLAILAAAYALAGLRSYFIATLMYFKKTISLTRVYLISAVIQVVMTIYFIKYFGIMGAVWVFLIIRILQVIFLYFECRRIFSYKLNISKQILLPVFYILMVVVSEQLVNDNLRLLIEAGQLTLVFTFVFWVFRNEIGLLYRQYKFW